MRNFKTCAPGWSNPLLSAIIAAYNSLVPDLWHVKWELGMNLVSVGRSSVLAIFFLALSWPWLDAQEDKKKDAPKKSHFAHFKHLKYRSIGPAAGGRVSRSCGVPDDP